MFCRDFEVKFQFVWKTFWFWAESVLKKHFASVLLTGQHLIHTLTKGKTRELKPSQMQYDAFSYDCHL